MEQYQVQGIERMHASSTHHKAWTSGVTGPSERCLKSKGQHNNAPFIFFFCWQNKLPFSAYYFFKIKIAHLLPPSVEFFKKRGSKLQFRSLSLSLKFLDEALNACLMLIVEYLSFYQGYCQAREPVWKVSLGEKGCEAFCKGIVGHYEIFERWGLGSKEILLEKDTELLWEKERHWLVW